MSSNNRTARAVPAILDYLAQVQKAAEANYVGDPLDDAITYRLYADRILIDLIHDYAAHDPDIQDALSSYYAAKCRQQPITEPIDEHTFDQVLEDALTAQADLALPYNLEEIGAQCLEIGASIVYLIYNADSALLRSDSGTVFSARTEPTILVALFPATCPEPTNPIDVLLPEHTSQLLG